MNKAEFYNNTEVGRKRQHSAELDYGVWWRGVNNWPVYRVTWVEDTGEVIAVCLEDNRPDTYDILGEIFGREEVERVLAGWAEVCGKPASLDWVRVRVREYNKEI